MGNMVSLIPASEFQRLLREDDVSTELAHRHVVSVSLGERGNKGQNSAVV